MKRIIFILIPVLIAILAFRPDTTVNVNGTVVDDAGTPIGFATVSEKGTNNSVKAKSDGTFTITVKDKQAVLVIMALGYDNKEVKLAGRSTISISLTSAKEVLEDAVIEGKIAGIALNYSPASPGNAQHYNTRAKRVMSGAISADKGYYHDRRLPAEGEGRFDREGYDAIAENTFHKTADQPLSTFSIDVDAASYSNVRRILNSGSLPTPGAVRIEEMVNYFKYNYSQPTDGHPFAIHTEIGAAPWNKDHRLVLVGLQGKKIETANLPASNLVFLIDVSGSMEDANKLPLVKASMKMLVDQLREQDHVSIVVYAGAAGMVLRPTGGENKTRIKEAIDNLNAGGSTAGGAGIRLAYKIAREAFVKNGNNRVILCTDGDFNVGESSDDAMEKLIEEERKSGVFLTVLGYGMGNYQDAKMQKLANKGNGNHAYIDGMSEAKKVLVSEFGGTMFTIAKDVKLQVEFNPAKVQAYRLIGYENRMLAAEDFNDDKKDAGELGSGHTVTALYEVIPVGVKSDFLRKVDDLKYQQKPERIGGGSLVGEIMTVKFRYKAPDGDVSKLIEHPVADVEQANLSANFRFAASVAGFGMLLRNSAFKSQASYDMVIKLAKGAKGEDEEGYRSEFIRLVESAQMLAKGKKEPAEEVTAKY